jgi:hypothetical protein
LAAAYVAAIALRKEILARRRRLDIDGMSSRKKRKFSSETL